MHLSYSEPTQIISSTRAPSMAPPLTVEVVAATIGHLRRTIVAALTTYASIRRVSTLVRMSAPSTAEGRSAAWLRSSIRSFVSRKVPGIAAHIGGTGLAIATADTSPVASVLECSLKVNTNPQNVSYLENNNVDSPSGTSKILGATTILEQKRLRTIRSMPIPARHYSIVFTR